MIVYLRGIKSIKSLSMSSWSLQPRISVTAVPQKRILRDGDKMRIIASANSVMRRSAHRFLFVNSKVN